MKDRSLNRIWLLMIIPWVAFLPAFRVILNVQGICGVSIGDMLVHTFRLDCFFPMPEGEFLEDPTIFVLCWLASLAIPVIVCRMMYFNYLEKCMASDATDILPAIDYDS